MNIHSDVRFGRGIRAALGVAVAAALHAGAAESFPAPGWADRPNPLASPAAVAGGEIRTFSGAYPESFNYYLANNTFSAEVFGSLYESLLDTDPLTAGYVPGLAATWSIGDDKRTFTFELDPRARWSDGRPVTAADVRWTFDAVMNPTNLTGPHKVALEKFNPPEVLSERVVRFAAREVHWRNLGAAGGFLVLPKHAFEGLDFNKINVDFPVVSGPYRLTDVKEGISARLARRADWWGAARAANAHTVNFASRRYRFFEDRENAYESFKKGELDIYPVYTSRLWVNETRGEKFDRNWIVKQRVSNAKPVGFQGFAMNMRRPPFDDLAVRQAMAHLLDREKMNRTLMYSQYFMHRSYFEDLYSDAHPCTNPVSAFDKARARALLAGAGWTANPKTGLLEKQGKPLAFKFLSNNASSDKFLSIFAEDLKDVGVRMTIDVKDWAAWAKDMDEFNYDMTWAAWSEGIYKDPEGMWASKEAARRGGSNITGFRDAAVDALIEKQKGLFDVEERHAICRTIDGLVMRQCPYVLLWNINVVRLLYWNRFGQPPTVLSKFGDEQSAYGLWWLDADADADLADAMAGGKYLPPRPAAVAFGAAFRDPAAVMRTTPAR